MTEINSKERAAILFNGPLEGLILGGAEAVSAAVEEMGPIDEEVDMMEQRAAALVRPGKGVLWGAGVLDVVVAADLLETGNKVVEELSEADADSAKSVVRDPKSMMLELISVTGGVDEAMAEDSGLLHGPLGPPTPLHGECPADGEMHRAHAAALGLCYDDESTRIDAAYEAALIMCRREQIEASRPMAVGHRILESSGANGTRSVAARAWREVALGRLMWAGAETEINRIFDHDVVEIAGLEAALGGARCRSLAAVWDSYKPVDDDAVADPGFDGDAALTFWQAAAAMAYVEAARAVLGELGVLYLLSGSDPTLNDDGVSRVGAIQF